VGRVGHVGGASRPLASVKGVESAGKRMRLQSAARRSLNSMPAATPAGSGVGKGRAAGAAASAAAGDVGRGACSGKSIGTSSGLSDMLARDGQAKGRDGSVLASGLRASAVCPDSARQSGATTIRVTGSESTLSLPPLPKSLLVLSPASHAAQTNRSASRSVENERRPFLHRCPPFFFFFFFSLFFFFFGVPATNHGPAHDRPARSTRHDMHVRGVW
jgi:hypothetical protein